MNGLLSCLRLLRAGTLFSPAGDVVAGLCLVAAALGAPVWSAEAVRAIGASVLLYAAGMLWNDVADRRADARTRPERPLPSGAVSLRAAVALGVGMVLGGLALSPVRGHHGLIAGLVLAYDFALKRSALLGAVAMGSLRMLNLATAAALAGQLPSTVVAAAACYGGYILAVTVLGILEDQHAVRPRAVVAVQLAPLLLAFSGLLAVQGSVWPAPTIAAVPILWFARRNRRTAVWDQAAIRRSMTLLLLGTMLYTALLCLATGRPLEALSVAGGIPAARAVTRALRFQTMS